MEANGFSDEQIANVVITGVYGDTKKYGEKDIIDLSRARKLESKNVFPVVKKIDTTAAEYLSSSNYLYMSYAGTHHDELPADDRKGAIVLGGGSYRIGTSVEFDWCAVSCSQKLQEAGWKSIIVNCNPETVSTDYNSSDRLYFEELTLERILDISDFEKADGAIASMGGQLPNKIALPLSRAGVSLLGHSPETIDGAEDRSKFQLCLMN